MANPFKDKPITSGLVGNAIFQVLWSGGSGVISFIAARAAIAQGLALHWAIALGVVIFLLLVLAANLLHLIYVRHRRYKREAANDPVKPGVETGGSDRKGCKDVWLHQVAEDQRKAIRDFVEVESFLLNFDVLDDSYLYIEIRFSVRSLCVYTLSLKRIDGFINFNNKPLHDPPAIASNELKDVTIGNVGWVTLRQKLKVEEAASILNYDTGFSFHELQVELNAEPGGIESGSLYLDSQVSNRRILEETPKLKMEVLKTTVDGLYDRETHPGEDSPELGSVINVWVKVQNPRRVPVEVRRFKLLTVVGQERHTSAQEGQICDVTLLQFGEIKQTRNLLKNLNNCPMSLEPKSGPVEGWLQFIVRDVGCHWLVSGNEVTLIAVDSRGEEHRYGFVPSQTLTQSKT